MPCSRFRRLAIPLMMTLVLGMPRFVHENSDGGWSGDYETSSTAPNLSERVPSDAPPDHARGYPPPTRTTPMRTGPRIGLIA